VWQIILLNYSYFSVTTLAGFLGKAVGENAGMPWRDILECITGSKREVESLVRVARRKVDDENNVRQMMTVMLSDWMKTTTKQEDKVELEIWELRAFRDLGYTWIILSPNNTNYYTFIKLCTFISSVYRRPSTF